MATYLGAGGRDASHPISGLRSATSLRREVLEITDLGRPALGLARARCRAPVAKLAFSSGPRKLAIDKLLPARYQIEPFQAELRVILAIEPHPQRIEGPLRGVAPLD